MRWVPFLAGGIVLLALALRLRDPLSNPVLAAEDPWLFLYRTQRLALKGVWPPDYVPGFMAFLAAAQWYGLPLFEVARLAPAAWGAAGTGVTFVLARRLGGNAAGLGAALLFAAMPELVGRGDFLAPTALDLAMLPLLAWCAVDLHGGRWRSLPLAAVLGAWLVVAHPWGLLYAAVALSPFALRAFLRSRRLTRHAKAALVAALVVVQVALFAGYQGPDTGKTILQSAYDRGDAWLFDPQRGYQLPRWVDPLAMLGPAALLLGALGAARGPRELRWLGGGWVLALLPAMLLPLTDVPYQPQRSVAFLAPGLALLGGAGVAWLWAQRPFLQPASMAQRAATAGLAVLLVLAATAPAATADPWWRIHRAEEVTLAERIAAEPGALVVAGSWQAASLYGAMGADVRTLPGFFRSEGVRKHYAVEAEERGVALLVVLDTHAKNKAKPDHPAYAKYDLSFLDGEERWVAAGKTAVWRIDTATLGQVQARSTAR